MQRVGLYGFTEGELEREKSNLLRSEESAYKQRDQVPSQDFVDQYVDHFLSGRPSPSIETEWALYQEILPQISLQEFDDVVDLWNRSEDRALLVVRPEETEGISDEELTAATLSQLEQVDTLVVEPYVDTLGDLPLMSVIPEPGSIVAEEQIESIDARRWTLSNGVTVIAKQTDFRDDEVEFRAFSPGGHSLATDEDHVSATYAAQLVGGSGVGPHDTVTLEKLLAGKRVSVSPFIGELFEGFSGNASPEDMETMFQLIALYATAPRLDPTFFASYEARLHSVAEFRAAEPDAILWDAVNTIRRQSHFRARPLTVGLLEELYMERAEAVYGERFANLGDATFVFVGAFEWDDLRTLTSTYLASLPNTGGSEEWRDLEIDPPPQTEDHVVHGGIEPRSNTVLLFTGDMEWKRQEALELRVLSEMLGIRLRERVREQLGGTYSISVVARDSSLPDDEYRVYIIFGSDPSRTEELFGEVMAEVEWLRSGGEQEYLDKAKELLRTERAKELRENEFWLNEIRYVVQRSESFEEITGFDTLLDELTLEDVAAAAQLYMTDEHYVRVVLLPEE
ncbi:MAG: insulinase family protein [Dehalococcoidia bacterium]|nr:insulinase family protein [Dehalococcoidia bacterium]